MSISSDAKDVALHFIERTTGTETATRSTYANVTRRVKTLLGYGYTRDDLIKVIDYIIDVKKVEMYSFGYINAAIENVLREIKKLEKEQLKQNNLQQQSQDFASFNQSNRDEVQPDDNSRNKTKSERFGVQSRFGEKLDFDMFEK